MRWPDETRPLLFIYDRAIYERVFWWNMVWRGWFSDASIVTADKLQLDTNIKLTQKSIFHKGQLD